MTSFIPAESSSIFRIEEARIRLTLLEPFKVMWHHHLIWTDLEA
jgi:hypothetical protein